MPDKTAAKGHTKQRAKIPRDEAKRRYDAVIKFYEGQPQASAAIVNKALQDGTLTGKKEPSMNVKKLYALRTQVQKGLAENGKTPAIPGALGPADQAAVGRGKNIPPAVVEGMLTFSERAKQAIKSLTEELRSMRDVSDVTIHRNGGVVVGRRDEMRLPEAALA